MVEHADGIHEGIHEGKPLLRWLCFSSVYSS